MNYIADMEARRAVRTFNTSKPLSATQVGEIKKAIEGAASPFGGTISVKMHKFDLKGKLKPSTYGSVEGAEWYILVGIARTPESYLTTGFRMEQVVLKIVDMGLGTNFMTDTFKGGAFADAAGFPEETPLHVIMPVGTPADKERLIEKMTHLALKSRTRRPFEETFGDVAESSPFRQPLEMMRLAPSAYNKQPWRAHVDGNAVWFYQAPSDDSLIGMGNGLANFWLTLRQNGLYGKWSEPADAPMHEGWQPVTKFTLD